jgi:hypothetical protein
MCTTH